MRRVTAISDAEARELIATVPYWYHSIEVRPGLFTPGVVDPRHTFARISLPDDLVGKRVLDIGARDGFHAFALEKRGAEVVAIDYLPPTATGFDVARRIIGSRVEFHQDNVYSITPERYGLFDLVLCLGVLYHLTDPLGALVLIRRVCRDTMWLETQAIDDKFLLPDGSFTSLKDIAPVLDQVPIMQFYPRTSLHGDITNYWAPNLACLRAMLSEARFAVVEATIFDQRAIVRCRATEDEELDRFVRYARGEAMPESG
jgi:tRNA (mo5U34)-methyltransferase